MTTAEYIKQTAPALCYGPAYRVDAAPFPDALQVEPLPALPTAWQRPRPVPRFTLSTARRPQPSWMARAAALLSL